MQPVPGAAFQGPWSTARSRDLELRVGGTKLGELSIHWAPLPGGGFRLSQRTLFAAMNKADGGAVTRTESNESEDYAEDLTLVRSTAVEHENEVEEREEITIAGNALRVKVRGPSHEDDRTFTLPKDHSNSMRAFATLRAEALGEAPMPRETRYRTFDSDDMAFNPMALRLISRTQFDTPDGPVAAWVAELLELDSGDRIRAVLDDAGLPLRLEYGAILIMLRGSESGDETSGDETVGEIDSSVPVRGAYYLTAPELEIEVTVTGDGTTKPDLFPSSPYQSVARDGERYTMTLHRRRASPGLKPPTLPLKGLAPDVARYLAPTPTSQSTAPEIVARAKAIVAGKRDSQNAARAIVAWVFRSLGKENGTRGGASAVETLASMIGDCTEHTALVVALARAAGIPARYATGIVLVPGTPVTAGYHAWPELWIGEWVAMDAALGTLDVGPSYLWLAFDEPNQPNRGRRLARLLGRTRIVIR